jgi:predicted site-specific integrase-resolvase
MTELMTSLCARLYGRRSAAHRAARAIEAVTVGHDPGGDSDG